MSKLPENASKLIARYLSGNVDQVNKQFSANKRTREPVQGVGQTPMVMKRMKEKVTEFDEFTDQPKSSANVVQNQTLRDVTFVHTDDLKVTSSSGENMAQLTVSGRFEERIVLLEERAEAVDRYKRYADGMILSKDNEIANLIKKIDTMQTTLNETKCEMNDEISQLKCKNEKLVARCKQLEIFEKSQAAALANSTKQCESLASELGHANSEIAYKDAEIERIDCELTSATDKLKMNMQKLTKTEREKSFLTRSISQFHVKTAPLDETTEDSQEIVTEEVEPSQDNSK